MSDIKFAQYFRAHGLIDYHGRFKFPKILSCYKPTFLSEKKIQLEVSNYSGVP
jgi:hypothetical protein